MSAAATTRRVSSEPSDEEITFRATRWEKERIKALAASNGQRMSEFLRDLVNDALEDQLGLEPVFGSGRPDDQPPRP